VSTDLGARGLDIAHLPVVVNHDLPRSTVDYVHRIGRTARAGQPGVALSLVSPATEAHFRLIEKRIGRRVPREQVPGFEPQAPDAQASERPDATAPDAHTGGVKGRRPSKKDKLRAQALLRPAHEDNRQRQHRPEDAAQFQSSTPAIERDNSNSSIKRRAAGDRKPLDR
jgi:ATP-dependent RNA helicase RhlE